MVFVLLNQITEDKLASETQSPAASASDAQIASPTEQLQESTDEDDTHKGEQVIGETLKLNLHIPPSEYMLGMADFTGELMRLCIFSMGNGDRDTPFQLVSFMRDIYDGFQRLGTTPSREVGRKMHTMKQSLKKVENACYTLHVRGSEMPQHMLLDAISSTVDNSLDFDGGGD